MSTRTSAPGCSFQSWYTIGVRVSMTARVPSASPAITLTVALPSGDFAWGSSLPAYSW
jgi:hypothetical protein